jgi:hypothetical protein
MNIASVCGIETEYGLLSLGAKPLSQAEMARALLVRCPIRPLAPFDLSGETPDHDALEPWQPARPPALDPSLDHAGYMLSNGARLYVDHGHPEYATPECDDPLLLVASDKAGELIMERCRHELQRFLPLGQTLQLFKNNSDHQGHSYGCHENYLVDAATYRDLFQPRSLSAAW